MRLEFEWLEWKNLFIYGNQPTKIDLGKSASTLIVGSNGAGKSTMLDALTFVLFGKPFRKAKKLEQLVNSINKKNMLVQVQFVANGQRYRVKRGLKPARFEILREISPAEYELVDVPGAKKDYQVVLDNILKTNMKSFLQICVWSNNLSTPFMRLEAKDRRLFIEDLLDLEIYAEMNSALKDRASFLKGALTANDRDIREAKQKMDLCVRLQQTVKDNRQELIRQYEEEISDVQSKIAKANEKLVVVTQNDIDTNSLRKKLKSHTENIQQGMKISGQFEAKTRMLCDEVAFFQGNDTCPTCTQLIDSGFKKEAIENRKEKVEEIGEKKKEIEVTLNKIKKDRANIEERISDIESEQNEQKLVKQRIEGYQREIFRLNGMIKTAKEKKEEQPVDDNFEQYHEEHEKALAEAHELTLDKKMYEYVGVTLAQIKGAMIAKYLPVINAKVNTYLEQLDFFVGFELNENFDETIKSRHRDEFTYELFSEGQKRRIDMSLMFAWRDIAQMRSAFSTNLLIMDEALDSSLNAAGVADVLKIMGKFEKTNLFVISHHEGNMSKFPKVLTVKSQGNFSCIEG